RGELLSGRKVREERVVDAHAKCAPLLHDAEAGSCPWLKCRHSNRRNAWQRTNGGTNDDFCGFWKALSELNTHLEAHSIDQKVRHRLRPLGDDLAVDVRLVQGYWRSPVGARQGPRKAIGHCPADIFVSRSNNTQWTLLRIVVEVCDPCLKA